ncbi:hypothetical protein MYA_4218 [Burkholderia sp. KJ006]|nr:hypothetical protein MYA_4218 [Burkholderia sp. KJ006]
MRRRLRPELRLRARALRHWRRMRFLNTPAEADKIAAAAAS